LTPDVSLSSGSRQCGTAQSLGGTARVVAKGHDPDVRTVIVDDSRRFRTLLASFLDSEPNFAVVGTAADGIEAEHLIDLTDPDVVILDAHMPNEGGLDVLEKLRAEHEHTMFVVTSADDTVSVDADRLGADLWIDKVVPFDDLCDAILRVRSRQ
jgi:DNA-binding NarL/FixJ family response regulator